MSHKPIITVSKTFNDFGIMKKKIYQDGEDVGEGYKMPDASVWQMTFYCEEDKIFTNHRDVEGIIDGDHNANSILRCAKYLYRHHYAGGNK